MIQLRRRQLALLLAVTLITYTASGFACGSGGGLLKTFRVALASSAPLINSLVASGTIPESRAQAIIADFNDGAGCGLALQNAFAAIPKDLSESESRRQKLSASVTAMRCFTAIVQRRNFAANGRIHNVASIAEGILASLVVFYSEPGEMVASAESSVVVPRNEKELEASLKRQVDALEKAMKP